MKIGVTGANGFVGTELCRRLTNSGHHVIRFVRQGSKPGFVAVGDIGPGTDWSLALTGCDMLVHLAARVHVMDECSPDSRAEFERVNFLGTAQLARCAVRAGVKRMVFMSTVKVHGERTPAGRAFSETDKPMPHGDYAASKLAGELAVQETASGSPMEWVIIRPPLIYGAGVRANFQTLAQAVVRGFPLPLGAVNNLRSMVSIDNLVDFVVCCLTHPMAANQHFLVSDDHDLSTAELAKQMATAAGRTHRLFRVPLPLMRLAAATVGKMDAWSRLSDNLQVDISKARVLLGWHPVMTVNQSLQYIRTATQQQ